MQKNSNYENFESTLYSISAKVLKKKKKKKREKILFNFGQSSIFLSLCVSIRSLKIYEKVFFCN